MSCGGGFVGAMCSVFVPTEGIGERVEDLHTALAGKFPFSLASDLGTFFSGEAGEPTAWPEQLAFMPLPFDELSGFFATVKVVVTVLMFAGFTWYLVDRLTPQVTI